MPKAFVTYKIRNERNGKFYVGSTNDTSRRWSMHRKNIREVSTCGCYLLRRDMEVNGWGLDDFSFGVIETFDSKEDMLSAEQALLDTYWGTAKNYNGAFEVYAATVKNTFLAWNMRTLECRRYISPLAFGVDFKLGTRVVTSVLAGEAVAPGDWVIETFSRRRTVREVLDLLEGHGISPPPEREGLGWEFGFANSISDLVKRRNRYDPIPYLPIKRLRMAHNHHQNI
ncbi:GIY-YIG nuclease family protein [Variovorax sp. KK3]|uniref:GIY-YIG nuclease family protein n=1 Tax=Variovorax sp. KK3 TaxID=1855728 RepID=UPI00097C32B8|nr:GIY-YIG nuclease family protein [Variovorax sp. KK3]